MLITDDAAERLRKLFAYLELTNADLKALRAAFEKPSKPLAVNKQETRAGLVIVDPQAFYCLPGWRRVGTENTKAIFPTLKKLQREFHERGLPVYITYMDYNDEGYENALEGFYNLEVRADHDFPIPKKKSSAFSSANLKKECSSKNLQALVLTCVSLSHCMKKTALAAVNLGFATYIAGDCVANSKSLAPDKPASDIVELKEAGVRFISSGDIPELISL